MSARIRGHLARVPSPCRSACIQPKEIDQHPLILRPLAALAGVVDHERIAGGSEIDRRASAIHAEPTVDDLLEEVRDPGNSRVVADDARFDARPRLDHAVAADDRGTDDGGARLDPGARSDADRATDADAIEIDREVDATP